ncbi:P2X purinoceptor 3a [Sinocyclocheilus anshuiensis]|uniref:P2X purinoceptor n=1 Tax=Sinocyclocheilus anshuiensis TaxID=1608454 RepID=A0A671N258_9TELE|nr:PREDICTED: P2X purinoceptor 3-like [Sinocyclocheilus anshuiensis]
MAHRVLHFFADFFVYETAKSVVVKSWSVGIINRVVQLLIILYFIGWVFMHEKGHQSRDTGIESAVMTKVKGLGKFNNRVNDVADYVVPSQGGSSFSIITSMVITANQTQGRCPETDHKFKCTTDDDCMAKLDSNLGNGIITGTCLNDTSGTTGWCEIQGWCPAEDDNVTENSMKEVENFTIFIKNSIRFPKFNVTRGNFPSSLNQSYIQSCRYDPVDHPFCPVFKVGDILRHINQSLDSITDKGGEIGININWKCNLDYNVTYCNPNYFFTRLDAAFKNSVASKGYNFRFAKYYQSEDGTECRTLHKAKAIRFEIIVSGNAGKFNTVPFLINLVTALTSVGLATVFCDIILLNFHKGADEYKAKKFEEVSGVVSKSANNRLYEGSQMAIKALEKSSNDSGTFSIGRQESHSPPNQ